MVSAGPATNFFFAFHYDNHKKALETTRKLAENSLGNHHLLFRLLCTGVIPFLYLSILNLLIYSRVRHWSNNLRNRLSWFTNSLIQTVKNIDRHHISGPAKCSFLGSQPFYNNSKGWKSRHHSHRHWFVSSASPWQCHTICSFSSFRWCRA